MIRAFRRNWIVFLGSTRSLATMTARTAVKSWSTVQTTQMSGKNSRRCEWPELKMLQIALKIINRLLDIHFSSSERESEVKHFANFSFFTNIFWLLHVIFCFSLHILHFPNFVADALDLRIASIESTKFSDQSRLSSAFNKAPIVLFASFSWIFLKNFENFVRSPA